MIWKANIATLTLIVFIGKLPENPYDRYTLQLIREAGYS